MRGYLLSAVQSSAGSTGRMQYAENNVMLQPLRLPEHVCGAGFSLACFWVAQRCESSLALEMRLLAAEDAPFKPAWASMRIFRFSM
jgi:hypothetical protein